MIEKNSPSFFDLLLGRNGYRRERNEVFRLLKSSNSQVFLPLALIVERSLYSKNKFKFWLELNLNLNWLKTMQARTLYLTGEYKSCIGKIDSVSSKKGELNYLKARCLSELGEKGKALALISKELSTPKGWLVFANLISSKEDFDQFLDIYNKNKDKIDNEKVFDYIILAALRCKEYGFVKKILLNKTIKRNITGKERIQSSRARRALKDIVELAEFNNIKLFIMSGTFLGYVRENGFISFDNDIDLGILGNQDFFTFKECLKKSQYFSIMPERSDQCIRVRHLNGTPIDIFRHWIDGSFVWHGGVKVRWWNSLFYLKKIIYLDIPIWAPDNPDRYLSENYGNWKIPIEKFDSAFDTPNAIVYSKDELEIYCLLQISQSKNVEFYKEQLKRIGRYENE